MTDLLREIPENPVPEGAEAAMMVAKDGRRIRYARFPSRGDHGTVVILPGRNECIEKYFESVRDLAARGFSAAALDWRGQGGSDRLLRDPMKGHVRSFNDYVSDLDQFFRDVVLPDCRPPFTVLGHSTGALIALLATPDLVNRVRRMVLIAPLLEIHTPLPLRLAKGLAKTLCALGLGRMYVAGHGRRGKEVPFQPNALTSDLARYERNQALVRAFPELFVGGPTAAWLNGAWAAARTVSDPDFKASIRLPILFLAAGRDQVVSTPMVERYARGLRSGKVLTIDGARHEILQEADFFREQALAAFEAFAKPAESGLLTQESSGY
ncbi:alpha/beta hydrolase [Chelativorans sp.]|uniref:alpha/beta hydrolase n=1 Tax=Chelativorans sp. TaxID=2203393 RepID=UPI0028118170|nr:alpha/beta hydrolase [Chelativorans sp.]